MRAHWSVIGLIIKPLRSRHAVAVQQDTAAA
jgi:hypothetical protein